MAGFQIAGNSIGSDFADNRIWTGPKRHLKNEPTAFAIDDFDAMAGGPDVKNMPRPVLAVYPLGDDKRRPKAKNRFNMTC